MKVLVEAIKSAFSGFLQQLSSRHSMKVTFGGDRAMTDGKEIWLPQLPVELIEEHTFLVKCHGHHEVAHVLETDFKYYRRFGEVHGQAALVMLNHLEDSRIESVHSKNSRSAGHFYEYTPKSLDAKGCLQLGERDATTALNQYMLNHLSAITWESHTVYALRAKTNFINHVGEGAEMIIEKVTDLLDAYYPLCESTADMGNLVLRIRELLKHESENAQEESQQGDDSPDSDTRDGDSQTGDESSDSDQSDGENEDSEGNEKDEQSSDTEPGESEGKDCDTDENDQSNSEKGDGGEGSEDEQSEGDNQNFNLAEAINELLDDDNAKSNPNDLGDFLQELSDDIREGKSSDYSPNTEFTPAGELSDLSEPSDTGEDYKKSSNLVCPEDKLRTLEVGYSMGANIQMVTSYLQQCLISVQETDIEYGRRGSLQASRIYCAGMGRDDFFGMSTDEEEVNASVLMLNDLSGSTKGDCSLAIQQTTLALAKALDITGVPFEVAGFGHNSRGESILADVKGFDEPLLTSESRIGGMEQMIGGGTPLFEALEEADIRISTRNENRRIMYILTDGAPSKSQQCAMRVNEIRDSGIEVEILLLGERINSDWLEAADIPFSHVVSVDTLTEAIMSQMQRSLLG